jgi:hypothetical protein
MKPQNNALKASLPPSPRPTSHSTPSVSCDSQEKQSISSSLRAYTTAPPASLDHYEQLNSAQPTTSVFSTYPRYFKSKALQTLGLIGISYKLLRYVEIKPDPLPASIFHNRNDKENYTQVNATAIQKGTNTYPPNSQK